jgi:hypothetical protein
VVTALPLLANAELVCMAYLRAVVGAYNVAVGTTLQGPDDRGTLSWGDTGFIQCQVVGGTPNGTVPIRRPVLSLDFWAVNVSGSRPPWNQANAIAELCVQAAYAFAPYDTHRAVTLPSGYPSAYVSEFTILGEPERRPADEANYAHYGCQVQMSWVALP